jgi:2',3'-cyclic-nucleotide 2'-phosphodiesterase
LSTEFINVLMLGDIIGNPGLKELFLNLQQFKKKENIDLVIANGENTHEGFGINEEEIHRYKEYGVDVITSGNHIWATDNIERLFGDYPFLLRPLNYPKAAGNGYYKLNVHGENIAVVNLIGRINLVNVDCPFAALEKLLKNDLKDAKIIIVDFHAESSFEKKALAYDFDGKISLIAGTHTHVQTADEEILPKGTGYITDLGLCGSLDSVIGMKKEDVIRKLINQIVVPYTPAESNLVMQGILARISLETKKTVEMKRISV